MQFMSHFDYLYVLVVEASLYPLVIRVGFVERGVQGVFVGIVFDHLEGLVANGFRTTFAQIFFFEPLQHSLQLFAHFQHLLANQGC
jgi:hypothetical protein